MSIKYVTITCARDVELTKAQLSTCFLNKNVDVLDDEDDLDRELKLLSNGRKTFRWWMNQETFDADFYFFCDNDTWVFTDNVEKVCSTLDPNKPFLTNYSCAPWGCVNVSDKIFGINGYPQKTSEFFKEKTGYTITWHGGAGMLISRVMCKLIKGTLLTDKYYREMMEMLCKEQRVSDGADALYPFVLPQDLLMLRALSLTIAKHELKNNVRRLQALPLIDKKGKQNYFSDHPWCSYGTGFQERLNQSPKNWDKQKATCDLNPAFPTKCGTKELDAKRAVELSMIHEHSGFKNLHISDDFAALCALHRIKKPEMFEQLHSELKLHTS